MVVGTAGVLVVVPLFAIAGYVLIKGFQGLTWAFFTKDAALGGPSDAYDQGGVVHAIVGTLMQVGIAIFISVPLGLMCAVFLNEIGGPLRRPVRIFVDAMSGVPTIIAGLFIYSTWLSGLGALVVWVRGLDGDLHLDAARHHAHRRGGPAPGPGRSAGGVAGARAPRNGEPSGASCFRRRAPVWSRRSSWGSPAPWARPPR